MTGKGKKKQRSEQRKACWQVTYRFVAMGTLMAYTAFGASKVAFAYSTEKDSGGNGSGQQTLVVRRFEIPEGTLAEALASFEKITGIHVNYAEEGIKQLHTEGVTGLYAPDQALKKILAEIQKGEFAKQWIDENKSGRHNFLAMRKSQEDQLLERVGQPLRDMMPFIKKKKGAGVP